MQYITPFPGYSKTLILRQKEEELRHAIMHNAPPAKLAKAAERQDSQTSFDKGFPERVGRATPVRSRAGRSVGEPRTRVRVLASALRR